MAHRRIVAVLAGMMLFELFPVSGAELKQETLDAWDLYLQAARVSMLSRAGGHFLWTDESSERASRVRSGEVVVSPIDGNTQETVPSGLIHHWIGAAFIPGARIDNVIAVIRDYDHYAEFYKPAAIDAKTLSRKAAKDRFSMVMVDKAMFMKRAIDGEYQSRFTQVDSQKWYSIAQTTRVQELAGAAQPNTRRLSDGEGSGYIWRMCTMSRYEERDGGVYVEIEAIALSRQIPAMLQWAVEPNVRRVSRSSLTTTLEQTRNAAGSFVKSGSALSASRRQRAQRESTNE
jgi:hypothetical protein